MFIFIGLVQFIRIILALKLKDTFKNPIDDVLILTYNKIISAFIE